MPNIHSTELILILVVALLVIGPERLPATIRTASLWLGRFRRSFYKVKAEIEREINADEVRRQLHNESVLADIRDAGSEVRKAGQEAQSSVRKIVNSKDFDPGASPATDEQARNAAAEREASVTGADAGAQTAETSESGNGNAGAAEKSQIDSDGLATANNGTEATPAAAGQNAADATHSAADGESPHADRSVESPASKSGT